MMLDVRARLCLLLAFTPALLGMHCDQPCPELPSVESVVASETAATTASILYLPLDARGGLDLTVQSSADQRVFVVATNFDGHTPPGYQTERLRELAELARDPSASSDDVHPVGLVDGDGAPHDLRLAPSEGPSTLDAVLFLPDNAPAEFSLQAAAALPIRVRVERGVHGECMQIIEGRTSFSDDELNRFIPVE